MTPDSPTPDLRALGAPFRLPGTYVTAEPCGSGHINDTYAVTYAGPVSTTRFIQQRVNHHVFPNVPDLMDNLSRVTRHLAEKLEGAASQGGMRTLTLLPAEDGKSYLLNEHGEYWRTFLFLENARSYDLVTSESQAYEAALAFGEFQKLLSDFPEPRLHETIPRFHDTPSRFANFQRAVRENRAGRMESALSEIEFYESRKAIAGVLLEEHARGAIPERVTHNDTKLNNVMIDDLTGRGVCVIDLDTVMPGLALYDFGDLVRTSTSPTLEDEQDLSKVTMQLPKFEALVNGYLTSAGAFLTTTERQYLAFSGKLIAYEIGLRFLTDYLEGDLYFKTKRPDHNLDRARTQMTLAKSIESQESAMNGIVEAACKRLLE